MLQTASAGTVSNDHDDTNNRHFHAACAAANTALAGL